MKNETLIQLWRYNHWANQKIYETLVKYGEAASPSSIRLLSHIADAQSVWLSRMTGEKQKVGVWEIHDIDGCGILLNQSSEGLKQFAEKKAEDLLIEMDYVNSMGNPYRNTFYDMLLQVFNHGGYHRGQIAQDLRKNGLEPINTDYIVFLR